MSKQFTDLMMDIETMGNLPTSAITSIAGVTFDRETGKTGPEFYMPVSLEDGISKGLTVDASTIIWWMEQSEEARKSLIESQKKAVKLDHALYELSAFIQSLEPANLRIWGNSNRFDLGILHSSFIAIKRKLPWKHTLERDVRTIVEFYPAVKEKWVNNFEGIKHDPIADCKNQIGYICEILGIIEEDRFRLEGLEK